MNKIVKKRLVTLINIRYVAKRFAFYSIWLVPLFMILVLIIFWDLIISKENEIENFLQLGFLIMVNIAGLIGFVLLWILGIFFWFRMFINIIEMKRNTSDEYNVFSLQGFINPFYGIRNEDLTEKGIYHRSLAWDGILGFIICCSVAMLIGLGLKQLDIPSNNSLRHDILKCIDEFKC